MPDPVAYGSKVPGPLHKTLELRRDLRDSLTPIYLDRICADSVLTELIDDISGMMPPKVTHDALTGSIVAMAGMPLTRETIDLLCWRLAGNLHLLVNNKAVLPWTRQLHPQWVPVQIINSRRALVRKHKPGRIFTIKALAGLCAGMNIEKAWTDRFCGYLARHIGFNRRRPGPWSKGTVRRQFRHSTELVSMRFLALIESKCCTASPGFERTSVSAAIMDWNRVQLSHRDRVDPGFPCPFNIPTESPCFICPHGSASCRAGTHAADYIFKTCASCDQPGRPFDPTVSLDLCIECYGRQALRPEA